jgi:hypothetical protein
MQLPVPRHALRDGHAAGEYPSPSALHVRRVFTSAHDASPGVHIHSAHTPAVHVCRVPHIVVVKPSPSALHTRRALPTHDAVPGVQIHPPQVPVVASHELPPEHAREPS